MEKLSMILIGAGLYWFIFWSMAVDTEGEKWWTVMGMVFIGIIVAGIGLVVGLFAKEEEE